MTGTQIFNTLTGILDHTLFGLSSSLNENNDSDSDEDNDDEDDGDDNESDSERSRLSRGGSVIGFPSGLAHPNVSDHVIGRHREIRNAAR